MEAISAAKTVLKREVTRLENKVNAGLLDNVTIALAVNKAKQLTDDCKQLLLDLASACDDATFESYDSEIGCIQDRLDATMCRLCSLQQPQTKATVTSSTEAGTSEVRLPKLTLPVFTGQLQEWLSFRDLFIASVDKNKQLSCAQKLQYLKASLKGQPALLIQSMSVTDDNYAEAWNILNSRYQNKREIVMDTIKRLVAQPKVQCESAAALRSLLDTTTECVRVLKVMDIPIEHWDPILVFHVTEKMDSDTRQQWELSLKTTELPTFQEVSDFLDQRSRALSASNLSAQRLKQSTHNSSQFKGVYHAVSDDTCEKCKLHHALYKCKDFKSLSVMDRMRFVKEKGLCYNCIQSHHRASVCDSGPCRVCNKKHHTLLHYYKQSDSSDTTTSPQEVSSHVAGEGDKGLKPVLLSTAVVYVQGRDGVYQPVRALLDCASETSFVTSRCVQRLGLRQHKADITVNGITATGVGVGSAVVDLKFQPSSRRKTFTTRAIVLPKITGNIPREPLPDFRKWTHIQGLKLADQRFYVMEPVDILLGADLFPFLMQSGKRVGPKGTPTALRTVLGWILGGSVNFPKVRAVASFHASCSLDSALRQFWEVEEVPRQRHLTLEEIKCEEHFSVTHVRENNKFSVSLPFKEDSPPLGYSRETAVARLQQMERKFARSPIFHQNYSEFMHEYLDLGHMEPVPASEVKKKPCDSFYLPHHAVINPNSTSTPLRVVFDASSVTSTGISLNDKLQVGLKLQGDIFPLLLRFRKHQIPLCADISKMYRQILIRPSDTDFQRIVWRDNPQELIRDYRLLTVTYGTSSAPYLATKCLQQLAIDEMNAFPLAAPVLLNDFYVDDLVSGASNVEEAIELQSQLIQLLAKGGFELRKWSSSEPQVLTAVPVELRETNVPLDIHCSELVKTLGLRWHPGADHFTFLVTLPPKLIQAKILIQELWKEKLGWDEALSVETCELWLHFCSELPVLQQLQIKHAIVSANAIACQLVGFCDASQQAYCAVVYLRSVYVDGHVEVKLVGAKTKVAPIKQMSLPRLELSAAVLLTRLLVVISNALSYKLEDACVWTDSTIVLAWLSSTPSRWKTFVANRVAEVQESLRREQWSHIMGKSNPADLATRGISASALAQCELWWAGPEFLRATSLATFDHHETSNEILEEVTKEEKKIAITVMYITVEEDLISRYSSFSKMHRIMAWIQRFVFNTRQSVNQRRQGALTTKELVTATTSLVKQAQKSEFKAELHCLQAKIPLPTKSRLLCLAPFVDEAGVIRVGGRLHKARITVDHKHPMLLPAKHKLTHLLIKNEHLLNLHAGPQLVLSSLQRTFWILRGRDTVRNIVKKCVTCHRFCTQAGEQLMGSLPESRINPSRPFINCGVDYAGPILLKEMVGRSRKQYKGYIALFVCFATKAVHLEIVSSGTTETFLAALRRFVSRRGKPSNIYSDCGTTFVGANRELKEFMRLAKQPKHNETISSALSSLGIQWHFNVPRNPHAGGLWESGVKSVKYHLKRVVGNALLTFEELYTVLTQIEACLNSRPLTALSSDPKDMQALTPGHFLIGDALIATPDRDFATIKVNRLSKWQLVQRLTQHFWRRWCRDYLSQLQQRPKWRREQRNLQADDLVVVRDDQLAPQQWRLGRVINVHPGEDGLVRAATVRTSEGTYKRPAVKLSLLPVSEVEHQ